MTEAIIDRAKQLKQHLTTRSESTSPSKMSNNPDLQLGEVFNVKNKVALVTGGGSGIGLMVSSRQSPKP